ncbi:unnamed protein product [Rhizophagus irregularis]|nr:unnamed protein product [Rhizophagus irregularis]CAB5354647.1 unnamed protein product [Rhizophagus irregularis]
MILPSFQQQTNLSKSSSGFSQIRFINDSGAFQEDELYFESLESQALAEPSEVPYMIAGRLFLQTSPALPPNSNSKNEVIF